MNIKIEEELKNILWQHGIDDEQNLIQGSLQELYDKQIENETQLRVRVDRLKDALKHSASIIEFILQGKQVANLNETLTWFKYMAK